MRIQDYKDQTTAVAVNLAKVDFILEKAKVLLSKKNNDSIVITKTEEMYKFLYKNKNNGEAKKPTTDSIKAQSREKVLRFKKWLCSEKLYNTNPALSSNKEKYFISENLSEKAYRFIKRVFINNKYIEINNNDDVHYCIPVRLVPLLASFIYYIGNHRIEGNNTQNEKEQGRNYYEEMQMVTSFFDELISTTGEYIMHNTEYLNVVSSKKSNQSLAIYLYNTSLLLYEYALSQGEMASIERERIIKRFPEVFYEMPDTIIQIGEQHEWLPAFNLYLVSAIGWFLSDIRSEIDSSESDYHKFQWDDNINIYHTLFDIFDLLPYLELKPIEWRNGKKTYPLQKTNAQITKQEGEVQSILSIAADEYDINSINKQLREYEKKLKRIERDKKSLSTKFKKETMELYKEYEKKFKDSEFMLCHEPEFVEAMAKRLESILIPFYSMVIECIRTIDSGIEKLSAVTNKDITLELKIFLRKNKVKSFSSVTVLLEKYETQIKDHLEAVYELRDVKLLAYHISIYDISAIEEVSAKLRSKRVCDKIKQALKIVCQKPTDKKLKKQKLDELGQTLNAIADGDIDLLNQEVSEEELTGVATIYSNNHALEIMIFLEELDKMDHSQMNEELLCSENIEKLGQIISRKITIDTIFEVQRIITCSYRKQDNCIECLRSMRPSKYDSYYSISLFSFYDTICKLLQKKPSYVKEGKWHEICEVDKQIDAYKKEISRLTEEYSIIEEERNKLISDIKDIKKYYKANLHLSAEKKKNEVKKILEKYYNDNSDVLEIEFSKRRMNWDYIVDLYDLRVFGNYYNRVCNEIVTSYDAKKECEIYDYPPIINDIIKTLAKS